MHFLLHLIINLFYLYLVIYINYIQYKIYCLILAIQELTQQYHMVR
jgi:hypothetical protein